MSSLHSSVAAVWIVILSTSFAGTEPPSPERAAELLAASDVAAAAPASFRALLEVGTGDGEPKRMELWKEGEDRLLLRFLEESERGKWLIQDGDELYFLTPNTRKPVRLGRRHRLWGRVFLREILGFSYSRDYRIMGFEEEDGELLYELEAESDELPYPRARYTIDPVAARPVSIELSLPSGRSARRISFPEWETDRRLQPRRLLLEDLLRSGPAVEVDFLELEPGSAPAGLFDPADSAAREALPDPTVRTVPER